MRAGCCGDALAVCVAAHPQRAEPQSREPRAGIDPAKTEHIAKTYARARTRTHTQTRSHARTRAHARTHTRARTHTHAPDAIGFGCFADPRRPFGCAGVERSNIMHTYIGRASWKNVVLVRRLMCTLCVRVSISMTANIYQSYIGGLTIQHRVRKERLPGTASGTMRGYSADRGQAARQATPRHARPPPSPPCLSEGLIRVMLRVKAGHPVRNPP